MESTDEDQHHATPKYTISSPAQCVVGNTKGAQYAAKKTRSTQAQCTVRKSMSTQAQCTVRKSMSTQSGAGHTESATTSNDRHGDDEAKKFDNELTRRVVKKKTVSESKSKKPSKNCIIS